MTAATLTAPAPRPLTRRLANVVRLHLANPFMILYTPLLIMGLIFAVNWVVWWLIGANTDNDPEAIERVSQGFQYSGASFWIFVYMMVVAVQAMNLTFPFALGFGTTRRDFFLGSSLAFVLLSAFYAVLYVALAILEEITNGWGVGGSMFRAIYFGDAGIPWWLRLFFVFVAFLFFFFVGSAIASMYVRWRQQGLIGFFAVFALLLIGGVALITWTQSWGAVGEFFARIGFVGGYSLALVPTLVAAVAAYLIMRRATPRT